MTIAAQDYNTRMCRLILLYAIRKNKSMAPEGKDMGQGEDNYVLLCRYPLIQSV